MTKQPIFAYSETVKTLRWALSDIVNPKLTSVCYDYASFGKMLAASAVKLLSGEEIPKIQQCVSRLIVRESTILQ